VITIVSVTVVILGSYFGLQSQVSATNARADGLEAELHQQHKIVCAIANKMKVDIVECGK
jgi:hypothetical protein